MDKFFTAIQRGVDKYKGRKYEEILTQNKYLVIEIEMELMEGI